MNSYGELFIPAMVYGLSCQLVAAFVFFVTMVSLDPCPLHIMAAADPQERLPEVPVKDRFLLRIHPVPFYPSRDPFGHPVYHIGGIGHHLYPAGPLELSKGLDYGSHLHPVVGGFLLAA